MSEADLWRNSKGGILVIVVEYGHSVVLVSLHRDMPLLKNDK